jgi:N-methylhydantoinase B/oxoprolinase/acetone carboxylase alpha subunit
MDMVTMSIIDSTMVSICREMGINLMKTSYSTIFNEGLDFTCALADAEGQMIAVAEFCPAQIGGMPLVVQSSVRELSTEPLEPGDVIVHNDPYRGGLHTPEHSFFTPIFIEGELMGYAVAIGHVAEVGGSVPGGFPSEATEIFHEGLRVPPIKIKRAGKDNDDVWKLLLANVRTPRHNYGDYRALIGSVEMGAERTAALIRKYGKEVFRQTCRDLMDHSEARMRAELRDFPDGHYSFDDYMEDDGIEDRPYRIHVDCHVQGDEIVVDFTGSSAQAKGPINATLGVTWSATYNALLHLTDPSVPKNSGCFRPIKVVAPPGTVVNVDYPAPEVGGNTETHPRIAYTVIGALAQAVPDRAPATDAATHCNFLFGGNDPVTGEYYVCYDLLAAGWGGRPFADGNNAVNGINGNCRMIPAEVFEVRFPWLIEELALAIDSGGAGRHRGGLGVTKRMLCREAPITISHMGDRHKRRPWGLFGGGEAASAAIRIQRKGSDKWLTAVEGEGKVSPSKFAGVIINPGDRVWLMNGGGGGWGDPRGRDQAKIAEDLREGWITAERARRDYGWSPRKPTKTGG